MKEHKNVEAVEEVIADTNATIEVVKYDGDNNIVGYAIVDNGNIIPCDKIVDDKGRAVIHLPSNSANRQWVDKKKVDAAIEAGTHYTLAYKASVKLGERGSHIPNEKLISYLSEELQAEYKAIIDRAFEAMKADKAKPLTDLEKAQAKLAKAKAAYEKLLAEQNA